MIDLIQIGARAKKTARALAQLTSEQKNCALTAMADALHCQTEAILTANTADVCAAKDAGYSAAMIERLTLTAARIASMSDGIHQVAALADPVGEVIGGHRHQNGMRIQKIRTPLGVVGIIYESRPNVTSDAAALCLKSGNACILRGGKEALCSNIAVTVALRQGLESVGLSPDCVQLLEDTSRETAAQMMRLNGYIDVLIPRGGAGLIQSVVKNATVPVIETGAGNCHVYIDASADTAMAVSVTVNAKASRPSVCNAAETLLVHRDAASRLLPDVADALIAAGVELRGCEATAALLPGRGILPAEASDWDTEYNDCIMAVRVVDSLEQAAEHITEHGTGHSECIVTESHSAAERFTEMVDAAAVYVNASTRFTDGGEFGMGAEIGISTQKLHTRGPMGLTELTTVKYLIFGNGQIR